jgi:hypothetical protein
VGAARHPPVDRPLRRRVLARPPAAASPGATRASRVLQMQRAAGNRSATLAIVRRQPETAEARLRHQAATLVPVLSDQVARADASGYDSIRFTVRNSGGELVPGWAMIGDARQRTGRAPAVSSAAIGSQYMRPYLDFVLMSGTGNYQFEFRRGPSGAMDLASWSRVEERRPMTDADELRALGIPNRAELYAEIFRESRRVLVETTVMIAGVAAEEIAWWYIGGAIFRVAGAALGRLPLLRRLVTARAYGPLARALNSLGPEAEELVVYLRRTARGEVLAGAEALRAEQLMARLEVALGGGGVRRALTLSREEMQTYLTRVWVENPVLARVSGTRHLSGEPLQRELIAVLDTFQRETGVGVQFVDEGVVQASRGSGNFASLRSSPGVLQIERQVLRNSALLRQEVQHEMAYYYAGGPEGVPRLAETFNALELLELMIQNGGTWPL